MTQLSFTGGGAFATSRSSGVDSAYLAKLIKQTPRATPAMLAKITGWPVQSIQAALASADDDAAALRGELRVSRSNFEVLRAIESASRRRAKTVRPMWDEPADANLRTARHFFVILAPRYTGEKIDRIAKSMRINHDLAKLRAEAAERIINDDYMFRALGRQIQDDLRTILPENRTQGVGLLF